MSDKIEVILVDIGSSVIKSAEVIDGSITNHQVWNKISDLQDSYDNVPFAVSSVRKNVSELKSVFSKSKDLVLDHQTRLPVVLNYETPDTLGPDRVALAVGANHLFPNENNLIIDMGTCITIDLIDKNGIFQGGTISPGLLIRMKAMSNYTHSLPDISHEWGNIPERWPGKNTKESLLSGSLSGVVNELNGAIETIRKELASINIILTGGDAKFFDSRIKAHIFAGSKIVEIGLYRIWKYQ
ncbi:MAG: type III pantothenate kinase [Cyclobacteriaceae bacterium]